MENQPKKSKALIITVIALILLLILGYFVFKNKDSFGVKTSTNTTKTFSPLTTSENPQTTIAQAGEDLSKGDSVSVSGTGSNKVPIVVKATNNSNVFGIANQNISNGNTGEIMTKKIPNSFFNSFSNFLGRIFKSQNQGGELTPANPNNSCSNGATNPPACTNNGEQCSNGADNFPACTTIGGKCLNGGLNPPLCNVDDTNKCFNGADNPRLCTTINGKCLNSATNPPLCTNNGEQCSNGADNFRLCTTFNGQCINFASNPPLCTTMLPDNFCVNGAINPPECTVLPGGLCFNGADNPDACTTINGKCLNFASNPPECSVIGGLCYNGATNPPECSTVDGKCLNGANNPTKCDAFDSENPDLVAGVVSPTSATVNTPTSISSIITNTGGSSTTHSFSSFFTIIKASEGTPDQVGTTSSTPIEISTIIPTLEKGIGSVAKISYTFTSADSYQIRACADKNSSINEGTVTESNEDNNCGPWTTFTVSNSLPTEGDICSNGADNPAVCTTLNGLCLNGANNPPECTNIECANGANNPPECTNIPETPVVNACLLIDQNPLTFTDSEKSQLAELLRKFYLIAPTLKTTDDISVVYSDILQQSNFSNQLSGLINECYSQTSNPSYTGPKLRYGNPWYKYDTRGSYLTDTYKNNPSYCTKAPGPWPHKSFNCPAFKDKLSCEQYNYTPFWGSKQTLNTGCTWVQNMNLKDYETILNIW